MEELTVVHGSFSDMYIPAGITPERMFRDGKCFSRKLYEENSEFGHITNTKYRIYNQLL